MPPDVHRSPLPDDRPVRVDRVRKSIGSEATFGCDLFEVGEMREALRPILDKVWGHCEVSGVRGRTATLKVKYADFRQITRSRSTPAPIDARCDLERLIFDLLAGLSPYGLGVRLLGVCVSSLRGSGLAGPGPGDGQFALPF